MKRLVALYDQHYPETIKEFWNPKEPNKLSPVFKFIKDFNPHVIVHGGDQLDLGAISYWNKGRPRLKEGKRLSSDYAGYNVLLNALEKVAPNLEEHVMLEGNHDYWIQMLIDENPQLGEGLIEVKKNLYLEERGIRWIDNGKAWRYGKLFFHHGDWKVGYSPEYHAKGIGMTFGRNMVYGHFHTEQSWTKVSPIDEHAIQTQCVGTLSHLNPAWLRNRPNAWINSFYVASFDEKGNFFGNTVKIINKKFIFDGTTYEYK